MLFELEFTKALAHLKLFMYSPRMTSFVTLTAEQIDVKFTAAGFTKTSAYNEVVYERKHRDPRYTIKVYTSLTVGASATRSAGSDAIRACLVLTKPDGKTVGVGKTTRVNRTGTAEGVLERAIERAREMWNLASRYSPAVRTP